MEIHIDFDNEEEEFIKDALQCWAEMMAGELPDTHALRKVLLTCALACCYEAHDSTVIDAYIEKLSAELKDHFNKQNAEGNLVVIPADTNRCVH